jgi:hypothetical protein
MPRTLCEVPHCVIFSSVVTSSLLGPDILVSSLSNRENVSQILYEAFRTARSSSCAALGHVNWPDPR